MSTTTKAAAHTPGAERAGYEIAARFRQALRGLPASTADTLAAIIDKETGAPEMLEALEVMVSIIREHVKVHNGVCSTFPRLDYIASAAIQKAKGGQ